MASAWRWSMTSSRATMGSSTSPARTGGVRGSTSICRQLEGRLPFSLRSSTGTHHGSMPTPGVIVTTSLSAKFIGAAAVAVAALGATSAAHARADVYVSFGVQGAPVYVQPAPVYVQPRPVYVQPEPVYVQPRPVYVQPPVYSAPEEAYVRPWPPGY